MQKPQSKRWVLRESLPRDFYAELADYPSVMRQVLYGRGVRSAVQAKEYLAPKPTQSDPFLLKGMGRAVKRIQTALAKKESIAIYGDYDVDGISATVLLVEVLEKLGGLVREYLPNRFEEGYGLNTEALDHLKREGVSLVITVDNGIRSSAEADYAASIGMDLIITDHHHPQGRMPSAVAVICSNRKSSPESERVLAGVGVAYRLSEALITSNPGCGLNPHDWLDLVALGTVADVMPLSGVNRGLVRAGLELIRSGSRSGLAALRRVARSRGNPTAGEIGFGLGPRLNASGRLESAVRSYQLLHSIDPQEIVILAQQLDDQNSERQKLTREAFEIAERLAALDGQDDILFAISDEFNIGLVGLVAARLCEVYYRPAVVGAPFHAGAGNEQTRASCRSIQEFHITRALDKCSKLMERHGGHARAAGFTVRNENWDRLRKKIKKIARRELNGRDLRPELEVDMEIPLVDLNVDLLSWLDKLEPTGQENPEAVFVTRDLKVIEKRQIGIEKQHLKMKLSDGIKTLDAIAFRMGSQAATLPNQIDAAYTFERNEFQGMFTLQMNIRDLKAAGSPP